MSQGYIAGEPRSGVLQLGVNAASPEMAQALGVSVGDAQQALVNFRQTYGLGEVSQVPYIILQDGEILAPGGVDVLGNLKDYLPAPPEMTSGPGSGSSAGASSSSRPNFKRLGLEIFSFSKPAAHR